MHLLQVKILDLKRMELGLCLNYLNNNYLVIIKIYINK